MGTRRGPFLVVMALLAACPMVRAGQVSREALQELFAEPVAVAAQVTEPPVLDGKLDDRAWQEVGQASACPIREKGKMPAPQADPDRLKAGLPTGAEPLSFVFSDPTTPGRPRDATQVRIACDAESLYVAFDCTELREFKAKATRDYDDKVADDDHVSLLLMPQPNRWCDASHANAFVLIKVNPNGAVWARTFRYLEGDARPGTPVQLDGLAAKAATYPGRWAVEVKVPFAALVADPAQMPALWKANFFRKRTASLYDSVQPGDPGYANWTTAWRPSACLATFCPDPGLFGLLYVSSRGTVGLPDLVLSTAGQASRGTLRRPVEAPKEDKVPPGFQVSPGELERLLRSPVAFVPHVAKGPEMRGDLSDPLWEKGTPLLLRYLDLFTPGEVEKNRTRVRILADDEALYIGYDAEEDFMQEIRAERDGVDPDGLWMDDCMDALLDPGRTEDYRYFYIAFNPKGAYTKRRDKNDLTWDPKGMVLKTTRGERGWKAELRVAFADLGIKQGEFPKVWGANIFRIRYARRPNMDETPAYMNWDQGWLPNAIGSGHEPEMFAYLYFEKGDTVIPLVGRYLASKGLDLAKLGLRERAPVAEGPPTEDPLKGGLQTKAPAEDPLKGGLQTKAPAEDPLKGGLQTETPSREAMPAFARAPKASRDGKQVAIRFAAKQPTDAAVWIADEKGKTVRHLAAGSLGANPPPPLKPNSLDQELVWDGKDDDGKGLPAGTYSAHVGLGLRAKFDRHIGWRPGIGHIRSLAVGAGGELFVFTGGVSVDHGWANSGIRVFDRDGRYLRQVYPFPSSLPAGKMRGIQPISLADGTWQPVVYNALNHSWLPECPAIGTQQAAVTKDGQIVLANLCMRGMGHGRRLLKLGTDGSAPADLLGPSLSRYSLGGDMYVAPAPDGKAFYVTGLRGRSLWDPGEFHNVVYKVRWDEAPLLDDFRKPFIGEFQKPGSDPAHLSDPRGIAVGKGGQIVVADAGNGRLAVFSPDGSPLKPIAIPGANKVAVHPKTGSVYVLTSASREQPRACALLKLRSLDDPTEVARLAVPTWQNGDLVLALDAEAEPPLLWLGNGAKVADLGDRLEVQGNLFKTPAGPPFADEPAGLENNLMYVDRATEEVYAGTWRVFDGRTGQLLRTLRLDKERRYGWGGEIALGPDRLLYMGGIDSLVRFDASGALVPFLGGKREVEKLFRGHGNSNRGHTIAPDGDIYYVHHYHHHGNHQTTVSQVAPDGTLRRYQFINDPCTSGSGIRVDRQGNVYVGLALHPRNEPYPRFLSGRLPGNVACPQPWFFYRQMYGSIVKFGPGGGRVVRDAAGGFLATNYSFFHACRIEGAAWVYHGFSPMHQKDVESSRCNCESARFDLDEFGRLFIPDALRSSVVVLDSNANPILRIGGYGNMDARVRRTADSPAPRPDIGLAWPLVVFATDGACYVADTVNSRIVRATLDYQAAASAEIRLR